jgi:hypothetical protein
MATRSVSIDPDFASAGYSLPAALRDTTAPMWPPSRTIQLLVAARDPIDERRGAAERHDMIVGERDREHRAADRGELGGASCHGEAAGDELVGARYSLSMKRA